MLHRSLRQATGLWYALLAVCLSAMITGCATFGARPQPASGHPGVAWQATDFRVVACTVDSVEIFSNISR